jgi:hypothetical protein
MFARKFFVNLQHPDAKTLYNEFFAENASSIEVRGEENIPAVVT